MGLLEVPPAYPTLVRMTPPILPNRESGPQNQPKAKVAVSVLIGTEVSIGGTVALGVKLFSLSSLLLLLQPNRKAGNTKAIKSKYINSLIFICIILARSSVFCM